MVEDIRIKTSFKDHRKRKKGNMILGLQKSITDYVLDLWLATAENHPDGILDGMDEIDIAFEAGWEGDSNQFIEALVVSGFLEKNGSGIYKIHDWDEHQPWVIGAKARSERARRAALIKHHGCEPDADGMPDACDPYATRTAPSPSPSPLPAPDKNPTSDSDEFRLAELLFTLITERHDKFKKPNLQTWAKHVSRMIRLDSRDPPEIEAVIKWCQKDPFWQNNILSTAKLREKYDQLVLKMKTKNLGSSKHDNLSSKEYTGTPPEKIPWLNDP